MAARGANKPNGHCSDAEVMRQVAVLLTHRARKGWEGH